MKIGRKSFPIFKVYTNTTENFGYHNVYFIDDYCYSSYKIKHQSGYDSVYEIELSLIPDGFIEDMSLWGAKNIEILQEERVLPEDGEAYNRVTTYYCPNPPTIKILESCHCSTDKGYSFIKMIITGRWHRKN